MPQFRDYQVFGDFKAVYYPLLLQVILFEVFFYLKAVLIFGFALYNHVIVGMT